MHFIYNYIALFSITQSFSTIYVKKFIYKYQFGTSLFIQLKAQKQSIIKNKEKEKERKARTKRLIKIGAIIDSIGIDSVNLANEFKNHFINSEKSKLWLENFISSS